MTTFQISEKTAALLPAIIDELGISNPILSVTETKTLIKIHFAGYNQALTIRKPKRAAPRRAEADDDRTDD